MQFEMTDIICCHPFFPFLRNICATRALQSFLLSSPPPAINNNDDRELTKSPGERGELQCDRVGFFVHDLPNKEFWATDGTLLWWFPNYRPRRWQRSSFWIFFSQVVCCRRTFPSFNLAPYIVVRKIRFFHPLSLDTFSEQPSTLWLFRACSGI